MRSVLASLFALAFLLSQQVAASGFLIDSYKFAAPGGVTPATVTFLQCAESDANLTTYTFSAQNTGTASADRVTVIAIGAGDGATAFTVDTVTVDGASATELTDEGGSGLTNAAIYSIANSAGTSEDVVVTFSEGVVRAVICLWQVNNSLTAAFDSATVFDTDSGTVTLDTDVPADGVAVGFCIVATSDTTTWTGLTERADDALIGAETGAYTAADYDEDGSASTPLAISAAITGTGDATCSVVSFNHI